MTLKSAKTQICTLLYITPPPHQGKISTDNLPLEYDKKIGYEKLYSKPLYLNKNQQITNRNVRETRNTQKPNPL